MKPARFAYHRPESVDEVFELLANLGEDTKLMAGGQSLVALMNMRLSRPADLIDLGAVDELSGISVSDDSVRIGAMTTYAEVEDDPRIAEAVPLLALAIPRVAHRTIRNRGTVGGSIAHADPAAEVPAVAMALGATINVGSLGGRRAISAAELFQGPYMTAIREDELIESVVWPVAGPTHRSAIFDVTRRPGDYALAGLACAIELVGGRVQNPRLISYATGPTAFRLEESERLLVTAALDELAEAEVAEAASTDLLRVRPDEEYRDAATQSLMCSALRWMQAEALL